MLFSPLCCIHSQDSVIHSELSYHKSHMKNYFSLKTHFAATKLKPLKSIKSLESELSNQHWQSFPRGLQHLHTGLSSHTVMLINWTCIDLHVSHLMEIVWHWNPEILSRAHDWRITSSSSSTSSPSSPISLVIIQLICYMFPLRHSC